ncbi:protein jag [Patescibacteria group bacterium]
MDIVEKSVSGLLDIMGFEYSIDIKKNKDKDGEIFFYNITLDTNSNLLIGQHGINLDALQHIVRILVRKSDSNSIRFILDINSYRVEKNKTVIEYAKLLAQRVIEGGQPITTRPMTAYERRLVHIELEKNNQVETESIGDSKERRVIIKPV